MRDYIEELIKIFPGDLSDNIQCPRTTRLFNINIESKSLDKNRKDIFHTFVMKCMFLAKRVRPDLLMGISFLSTRVLKSNEEDWKKLIRLFSYLKNTKEIVRYLEADDAQELKWYMDASVGAHNDMKSHIGSILPLEKEQSGMLPPSMQEAQLLKLSWLVLMTKYLRLFG